MTEPKRGRPAGAPVLQLSVDAGTGVPLHRQVRDAVRDAILAGRLAPGARLPSSRSLAADLGVGRNTVLQAFDQLRSEGYIAGCRGGGTRVRPVIPDALLAVNGAVPGAGAGETTGVHKSPGMRVARRAAPLGESTRLLQGSGVAPVPFELGVPAVDVFPTRLWWRLSGRRWRRGGVGLSGGQSAGEPELRQAIAEHVSHMRDARCTADQVLVVSGAQQALHLVAQVVLDPGDAAWMEEPGYTGARAALELAGAAIVPVPVDGSGLDVAQGEALAPHARLAYVTPSHQFPLGSVLSVERRLALLSWARRHGAWIVEDDYDSEFRYAGRPLACLQGLDAAQAATEGGPRVLYVGTFSKTLAPALRLGYLIVPDGVIDAFRAVRAAMDMHPPVAMQQVLADFINEGHHARHVRRVRALAAERQALLLDVAGDRLAGLLELTSNPAGLHVVGMLADGMEDVAAAEGAAAAGVKVAPLSRYRAVPPAERERGLLLGYAGFTGDAIRASVERLRAVLLLQRAGYQPSSS